MAVILPGITGNGTVGFMIVNFRVVVLCGLGIALVCFVGCSSEPRVDEGSWYDHSRDYSRRRQDYVGSQMDAGVTELDAKNAWERDQMIGNTLGSWEEMNLHGSELHEIIDAH